LTRGSAKQPWPAANAKPGGERQARCRAARTAGKPAIRMHRPALAGLRELQTQYVIWLDALPDNLLDSTTADALQTICDIDLADLQAIEPPRGFGRELTQTS
jgi:hypothetical protein